MATPTLGGYSRDIVVDEHFVLTIPEGLDGAGAAPMMPTRGPFVTPACRSVVVTNKDTALEPLAGRYDAILDTISAKHDLTAAVNCLKPHRTLILSWSAPLRKRWNSTRFR